MKSLNTYITEKFVDIDNYKVDKRKYELTDQASVYDNITLYQIRALRTFKTIDGRTIRKGDLGGWIESEANLSQEGSCWVADKAQVYGNAQILDKAIVYGRAKVYGEAQVYDNVQVCGRAWIGGHAQVYGNAQVYDSALVYGNAKVCGNAKVDYKINKGIINK